MTLKGKPELISEKITKKGEVIKPIGAFANQITKKPVKWVTTKKVKFQIKVFLFTQINHPIV